jgi:uncharacterized protein
MRVIAARRQLKVALSDGSNALLPRRIRAHGNFAEYVPLSLILIAFAEIQKAPHLIINGLGIVLVLGRLVHAYGITQEQPTGGERTIGMALSFVVLIVAACLNLVLALR